MITGATGQDGAYLAEFLLRKGYAVHFVKRRSSSFNTARVDHLYLDVHESGASFYLHYGDLTDATNLIRLVQESHGPGDNFDLATSHVLWALIAKIDDATCVVKKRSRTSRSPNSLS
jgi:GDPmannose 4,6-dehydratase